MLRRVAGDRAGINRLLAVDTRGYRGTIPKTQHQLERDRNHGQETTRSDRQQHRQSRHGTVRIDGRVGGPNDGRNGPSGERGGHRRQHQRPEDGLPRSCRVIDTTPLPRRPAMESRVATLLPRRPAMESGVELTDGLPLPQIVIGR